MNYLATIFSSFSLGYWMATGGHLKLINATLDIYLDYKYRKSDRIKEISSSTDREQSRYQLLSVTYYDKDRYLLKREELKHDLKETNKYVFDISDKPETATVAVIEYLYQSKKYALPVDLIAHQPISNKIEIPFYSYHELANDAMYPQSFVEFYPAVSDFAGPKGNFYQDLPDKFKISPKLIGTKTIELVNILQDSRLVEGEAKVEWTPDWESGV